MRRLVCLSMVLLLLLASFTPLAMAANDTTETAIQLTPQNSSHFNRLIGDTGGAVTFYRIDYAGAARPVKIDLTARPGRDTLQESFGFKLYGPSGFIGEATVESNEPNSTRFSLTLSSVTPGAYFVQVYNFTSGIAVDFVIEASGLAEATIQPDSPTGGGTSPDSPIFISRPIESIGGNLVGGADGALQYFSFEYAPGASVNIELRYSPPSPFSNDAVGFNLYRGGKLIGQGSELARDGEEVTVSFTLADEAAGLYLLQVFNYEPGLNVGYVLVVSGAAGIVQQATDNTVPEKALALVPGAAGARGTIDRGADPGAQASFHFYGFNHPGEGKSITISFSADRANDLFENMVGFNLYQEAELAGQAIATFDGKNGVWVASFSVTEDSPTTYGIQVYNYSTATPVNYSIYVTGL